MEFDSSGKHDLLKAALWRHIYFEHYRYGGGETKKQTWPIESVQRPEAPFVTGDFLGPNAEYGGVVETYWLTSSGVAIHVDEDTPLFMST